jgi:hypothetical protein
MTDSSKNKLRFISIEKASGDKEPFSSEKLFRSLRMSGASDELVERVVRLLQDRIEPGITTQKLYRMAFSLLHKEAHHLAARYSLKRAIMNLGPTGFPFEKLVAGLLSKQGYQTRLDVYLHGACVEHEVDVIASKANREILVECKYYNNHGKKCDVKVALYVYARSLDLQNNSHTPPFDEFWLVTNTKFTQDAIKYGECTGLKLLSWDYPQGKGLKELIELGQLHPITCLTTMKSGEKRELLKRNIVLCHELTDNPDLLRDLRLSDLKIRRILKEVHDLTEI